MNLKNSQIEESLPDEEETPMDRFSHSLSKINNNEEESMDFKDIAS